MRKKQFIAETEKELRKVKCCSILDTIFRYLSAD